MDFDSERLEAIGAGERALMSLNSAYSELQHSRNWGMLDLLGARGAAVSLLKHWRMQKARDCLEQAQRDLASFGTELDDVNRMYDLNLNVSGLLTFADVFLDNFFVDLAVQNRIKETMLQVAEAIGAVETILDRLKGM